MKLSNSFQKRCFYNVVQVFLFRPRNLLSVRKSLFLIVLLKHLPTAQTEGANTQYPVWEIRNRRPPPWVKFTKTLAQSSQRLC